jgi:hypothetical protein
MADNTKKLQNAQKEELKIVDTLLKKGEKITAEEKKQLKLAQERLSVIEKELKKVQLRQKVNQTQQKETESFLKSYSKLNGKVQQQLAGQAKSGATYLGIGRQLAKEKAREVRYQDATTKYGKEQKEKTAERLSILGDINTDLLSQAKATQAAQDKLSGTTELQKELRELETQKGVLTKAQYDLAKKGLEQKDKLRKKEERLTQLAESQKDLYDALPDSIKGMVSGAQKFGNALKNGALPIVLMSAMAIAVLSSFTKLDKAAEDFRTETGMTASQMGDMQYEAQEIAGEFGVIGVEAKDVFDTVKALRSEFSDIVRPSKEVLGALTVMQKNFGVSAENAAQVQGILEQIGGLSSETAASVQMQVAEMANMAGVAPNQVIKDIAENAEIASTLFQGDVESLAQAAIEARRLGTNLKSVATTTEHLLDFQGNIGDELTAATFVGGQFNLTQARSLAAAGKTVEAQKEVLKQLQRSGDFRKKDYFTQQQLAKAAGMSVEEINKQLNAQDKLNSLSSEQRALAEKAISQGLDISNINKEDLANKTQQFAKQQEIQGSLTKITDSFNGLISAVGTVFLPIMETLSTVFGFISSSTAGIAGFMGTLVTLAGVYYGIKLRTFVLSKMSAIQEARAAGKSVISAVASIFQGQGKLPIIGAIIAAGMIGTLFAALSKAKSQTANDFSQAGYGKRTMFSPEGTISFNDNDTILAGTNLGGGGGSGMTAAQAERLIAGVEKQRETYLDGRRVTANVSRAVEKSTMNNFAIG